MTFSFVILFKLLTWGGIVHASQYSNGSKVEVYVNKVGPFYNPHETYHYYQLPVCQPEVIEHKSLSLGEVLDGDRMAKSLYSISFKETVDNQVLCKRHLNEEGLTHLKNAIEDLYYFEFVIDEIPVRGFIGHLEESGVLPHSHKIFLSTHLHFNIEYNNDQIIYANVTTKEKLSLSSLTDETALDVTFKYSVRWIKTDIKYSERAKRVQDSTFFPKTFEIHWLSIINSIVLVSLLVAFVIVILMRVVHNDLSRYNVLADEDGEDGMEDDIEDYGWKLIHGDVFRFPPYISLLSAVLGVGTQFLAIVTGVLMMAILNMFNVHRHGTMDIAVIVLYALTSVISGYVSATMYQKFGGVEWLSNVNLTSALFTLPLVVVWTITNTAAWVYGSTQALPWTTVVFLIVVWGLIGYPLTVLGAMIGRKYSGQFEAPIRTKAVAREIPSVPWYKAPALHCVVGGFLPFSAISVELYYIFATLWGREQYTLYGILFVVYVILLSVTVCISVALTYFQLSVEDYRWWWRSIFSAGSTGLFVFAYGLFYYVQRSNMSGALQTAQFFGYTILSCYAFCMMLGAVSFFASLRFVKYIYVSVKVD